MLSALRLVVSMGLAQPTGLTAIFQDGQFPTSRYAGTSDVIIAEYTDRHRDAGDNYDGLNYLQVFGFPARQSTLVKFQIGPGSIPGEIKAVTMDFDIQE